MQKCQICGKENPPGVEYCEDCGASLTPSSSQPAAAGTAQDAAAQPGVAGSSAAPQIGTPASDASLQGGGAPPPAAAAAPPATAGAAPADASGAQAVPQRIDAAGATGTTEATGVSAPSETAAGAAPGGAAAGAPAGAAAGTAGVATVGTGRARLAVRRYGALTGDEIPLAGERLVVGRFDPETGPVDIDLSSAPEGEQISRQHGELYREGDGQWYVRDLGSTNGVFVKGKGDTSFGPRITAPRALSSGDELAFGNARFVFLAE